MEAVIRPATIEIVSVRFRLEQNSLNLVCRHYTYHTYKLNQCRNLRKSRRPTSAPLASRPRLASTPSSRNRSWLLSTEMTTSGTFLPAPSFGQRMLY